MEQTQNKAKKMTGLYILFPLNNKHIQNKKNMSIGQKKLHTLVYTDWKSINSPNEANNITQTITLG